jgi:hypothetical protein
MAFDDQQQQQQKPVPMTGQQSFGAQEQNLQTGYGALGNVMQQAGKTADLWSSIGKANEASTAQGLQAMRRQAAQTLYANRGSLGGGGGLAAMQQANTANQLAQNQAVQQANLQRAQLAAQGQEAGIGAQQQIAQAAGQRYRMLQDQQQRQVRINQALDMARQVMQRNAGTVFTTGADRMKALNEINREVLATESDPQVIAAVQQYLHGLMSGNENVPNTIDV